MLEGRSGGIEQRAYAAAFEEARAAQLAAAKEALVKHAAVLEDPSAARYRAQLQSTAGDNEAAMKSYLAYAKTSDSAQESNDALVLAANLCKVSGAGAEAAKTILDQVDASQLSESAQRMHKSLASGLAADIKREQLHGRPAPRIAGLHVLGAAAGKDGESFSLLQFLATWCGPCRVVIPGLVEMQKKYGSDLQVLGVTRFYGYCSDFSDPSATLPHGGKTVRDIDDEAELAINRVLAERFELNYPIVVSDAAAGQDYVVRGIPTDRAKIVKTVDRLLGRTATEGHAEEASDKKHSK